MLDPNAVAVRWGVAGTGSIASDFAEAMELVDDGAVAAVASRTTEAATAFAGRHGIGHAYGSYEALAEDPDVDIVYVATPHSRHAADTLMYLEAGKHVLCEKPFALNAGEATAMADAARSRGLFLMDAVWSRFLPSYRSLADVLGEGRIGEPLLVEADFGFRADVDPAHRLFDLQLGGGALLDLGIYPVQLCSMVLGAPDSVVALGSIGATGVDEQVAAVLHQPDGSLGVIKAAVRTGLSCTARISGSEGWIDLPAWMHCPHEITVSTRRGIERLDCSFSGGGLRFEIEAVHRSLLAGETESNVMPLTETLQIMSTLDAIRAQIGLVYPGE